ncbi:hypothetical protein [Nocardia sp. NPDC057668]
MPIDVPAPLIMATAPVTLVIPGRAEVAVGAAPGARSAGALHTCFGSHKR